MTNMNLSAEDIAELAAAAAAWRDAAPEVSTQDPEVNAGDALADLAERLVSAVPPPRKDNPADVKALDLLMSTLMALNMIDPDNEHDGDTRYATSAEGMPYWHVEQAALKAAVSLLGGNQRRAEQLMIAMIRDGEPVRPVLARLRQEWVDSDPVGEAVRRMMYRTEMPSEENVVRWAALRAGFLWRCADCKYLSTNAVDECESCGKPRPTTPA